MSKRIFNFSAGPATMPLSILEQVRDEMLNHHDSGMSVMEMSHRSNEFRDIKAKAEAGLRRVMDIPDDYEVLFIQGGASMQFAMVPMNLYVEGQPINVINTGAWTKKALVEINKVATCHIAASTEAENFRRLPTADELDLQENASYVHLCSNNTIWGTQWQSFPDTGAIPLVADMSSDILSRPVDVNRFGLIFAGAQKNIGPAGVTVVIVQRDLAERAPNRLPTMLQYRTYIDTKSGYNTPPTFAIYIVNLMMDWIEDQGGVAALAQHNVAKAALLYNVIDDDNFYLGPAAKPDRSNMNVLFRIDNGHTELEQRFVLEAEAAGLTSLKGHRSAGGLRASIYNAQPLEAVEALVEFMLHFAKKYG